MSLFGNAIDVIWQDDTLGPDEILYKRSFDNGNSFFETMNISQSVDIDSINGKIYAINNKVYIVWTEATLMKVVHQFLQEQVQTVERPLATQLT